MAFNYLHFDQTLQHGRLLRSMLTLNEQGDDALADVVLAMTNMLEGDGTSDAHYGEIMTRFGFVSTTKAHAAYNELSSMLSKTSGNGTVSDVRAARDQVFNYFRG